LYKVCEQYYAHILAGDALSVGGVKQESPANAKGTRDKCQQM